MQDLSLQEVALNSAQKIVDLNKTDSDKVIEDGMNIKVFGSFIKNSVIFHDNRSNLGRSGYHVYSVFEFLNGQHQKVGILVNRGWVKMNLDRRILPDISTSNDKVTIMGRIRFPVKNVYQLAESETFSEFPRRVQTIEVANIQKSINVKLLEFTLLLGPSVAGDHFDRQWDNLLPGKYMTPDKHYAYSLQWLSLAVVSLVIFIVMMTRAYNKQQSDEV